MLIIRRHKIKEQLVELPRTIRKGRTDVHTNQIHLASYHAQAKLSILTTIVEILVNSSEESVNTELGIMCFGG
jgi:hypothetical protein